MYTTGVHRISAASKPLVVTFKTYIQIINYFDVATGLFWSKDSPADAW